VASAERRSVRVTVGVVAAAAGVAMVVSSFLTWVSTPVETGGRTRISGFGAISGASDIAGTNLNDVLQMGGGGSYRPGLLGLIFGGIALVGAAVLLLVPGKARPHRVTAAVLILCGLVGAGWGLLRALAPGSAGVLEAGDGRAGLGPWLLAAGGFVLLMVGTAVLAGLFDTPEPDRHRGIQG
jgi:hypothetical protein